MQKQQRLLLLILCAHLIQVHRVVTEHLPKIQSTKRTRLSPNTLSKCPHVWNDEDVVTSSDFIVPLNPTTDYSESHGMMDDKGHIFHLKIVNKNFIPSTLFALKHLKQLEIRNSCFSPCRRPKLPSTILCLASSLTELAIYDTNITLLPLRIGNLVHLQVLILSNTGLISLPDTIGYLSSLTILYLPNNNLTSLPPTIRYLRSLQQLTLSNNPHLRSLRPLDHLPSLIFLDTRDCSITTLPQHLPQLTTLYVSNNSLTKVTDLETLGEKTNSPKLFYLDYNCITSLPSHIDHIKNLSLLKLNANNLDNLPRNLFNIVTLRHLNIQHNQFDLHDLESIISPFRDANSDVQILYKNQTHFNCRSV